MFLHVIMIIIAVSPSCNRVRVHLPNSVQELFKSNVDKSTMTTTSHLTKNIKKCKSREMVM